jgi:competence protein ComEA
MKIMKILKKKVVVICLLLAVAFAPISSFAQDKININTATVAELTQLPGIGEKTAEKIYEYRMLHKFKSVDELVEVSGIGEKTLAKFIDQVTVEEE